MLPTDLQLLVRFKLSGQFQSCPCQHTHNAVYATPGLCGLHTCNVYATYMTQLAAERHMVVYREWKA